jgi:hypothetical protein
MPGVGAQGDCAEGGGGVLFVGVAAESNGAIVGTRAFSKRNHGGKGGQGRLPHSQEV